MAVGALVLLGWLTDTAVLKGAISDGVTMKANTAICLFLAGFSLFLSTNDLSSRWLRNARTVSAVIVAAVGLATLSEHLVGWNLGIDQLLVAEAPNAPATVSPGRMGPPSATSFLLLGLALLIIRGKRRRPLIAQWLAVATVFVAVPGLLGHLYGAEQLYALSRISGIALSTSLTILMLALGVLSARPETGLTKLFVQEQPGGAVLRRVILPSTALLVVLGALSAIAQERQWADAEFAAAIVVVVLMIYLLLVGTHHARVLNMVAQGRDVAERERERLLESERAARTEAERATRAKDEFLTTISHELRTPLSGILGWTKVLQRTDAPDLRRQALDAIERGARAQAQLIDDLLDVSGVVSGKVRLDVTTLEVGPLVEEAINTLAPAAEGKSLSVERVIDNHAGLVKGDSQRLQQVFWNLLANAIKFTANGGKVRVVVERVEASVVVTVSDNGIGIAPAFLPNVFDRFRQQDGSAARKYGGLGLGLAIVKHIVDLHGGSVTAQSDGAGKGATFSVRLPVAIAASDALAAGTSPVVGPPGHLRGIKVLLVDDDVDSLESVRQLLSEYEADVMVSESASEALAKLEHVAPDVVVADIGMPNMDGYTMMRQLRARETMDRRRTPAIALTAFSRAEDRIRALEAGYTFHLSKPVDLRELVAAIGSLAHAHHAP
jgi:signal transduction histidine kinase/ActR/RegA family two-component response regulator